LRFVHPIAPPTPEALAPATAVPQESRRHVHVFLVHGVDPLDLANLEGVRKYIQSLGYPQVYCGQAYEVPEFRTTIRRIHKEDPGGRFVLMGFSLGANRARDLANAAGEDHIPIDLLVYAGGNTLKNTPADQPANALRIANILASGCIWNGAHMDRADNISCADVWHFGSPSHPRTLAYLARELAVVAERVPAETRPGPAAP
jgi:hypothetical protein